MEIPKHTCNRCHDEITNPHQIEKETCHNCSMFELGRDSILEQADRLKMFRHNHIGT